MLDDYIEGWKERARRAAEARGARESRARELLPTLVNHLVEHYGARRVVLFGSLAEGWFRRDSDIDLAVEGIEGMRIYRAAAELDDIALPIRVDLVPLENARPELINRIESAGQVLHGV
jgi:predicted nucleotidyltransferase